MSENNLIMVIDDDKDILSLVNTILSAHGYEVETFSRATQALSRAEESCPNLILLDIMMPEMSGYDMLVRLKQKPETQNIPVIMVTAKDSSEDVIIGYKDYGVEYYITKPFTTRQLLAGVELVLDVDDS